MRCVELEGIEIFIEHKPKNRNSYITIDHEGKVTLKTPMKLSFRINALLRDRLEWIKAKRLHVSAKTVLQHTLGESLILDNALVPLDQCPELHQQIERLHVRDDASMERCYNAFYLERSKALLPLHVKQLSEAIGLSAQTLRFRKMKRQWGNCNSKGVITLNTHLMKLSQKQRAYVIAHELCHLKHMNHSRDFYQLLYTFMPDAKEIEKELKSLRF